MLPKKLKLVLGPLILLLTLAAFAHYLNEHRVLLTQLRHTSLLTIISLILLYGVAYVALLVIMHGSVRMYHKKMGLQENFLLNAYSSLVNFFGPGQSGPAVRGAYLYKRHGVRVKDFMFTTLLYLAMYAVLSACLLVGGSQPWPQALLLVIAVGAVSFLVVRRFARRSDIAEDKPAITPFNVGLIAGATVLQGVTQIAIYFIELHSVNHGVSLRQAITYTGAANFALFVALTPGAIGIRESFLLFTRHLHHISSANIVSANIIDRGVFILLGVLFVLVLSLHAKDKLKLTSKE